MPEDDWEFFDYLAHGIKMLRDAEQDNNLRIRDVEKTLTSVLTQLHQMLVRVDVLWHETRRREDA